MHDKLCSKFHALPMRKRTKVARSLGLKKAEWKLVWWACKARQIEQALAAV